MPAVPSAPMPRGKVPSTYKVRPPGPLPAPCLPTYCSQVQVRGVYSGFYSAPILGAAKYEQLWNGLIESFIE